MQMKRFFLLLLVTVIFVSVACSQSLSGFSYGRVEAPAGNEWESPQLLSLNKEQPKAWFFNFANEVDK